MALFLPQRWRRQPTGPVRIDYGNPVAKGIIAAYPMWRGALWNAQGAAATLTGTRAGGANAAGEWFDLDGSSYLTQASSPFASGTAPFTLSWYAVAQTVPSFPSIFCSKPPGASNTFALIRADDSSGSGNYRLSAGPAAGVTDIPAWTSGASGGLPALAANTPERMVLVCAGGTSSRTLADYRLMRNSAYLGTAPSVTSYGAVTTSAEHIGWDSADSKWDGLFGDFIIWGRALSQAEMLEYSNAPYQIYQPLVRRMYFGIPSVGGSGYTLTANHGTLTLAGQSATLLRTKQLTASHGTLTLAGQSATILRSKLITASHGTLTLAGQSATLTYTPAGSYVLTCQAGTLTLAGQTATILKTNVISASHGTLTLTGRSATISWSGDVQSIWTSVSAADSTWTPVTGTTSTWTLN